MAKRQNDIEHKITEKDLKMNPELKGDVKVGDTILIPKDDGTVKSEETIKSDETVKSTEKASKKEKPLTIDGNLIISHKIEEEKHILKTENGLGYILNEDEFAAYVK